MTRFPRCDAPMGQFTAVFDQTGDLWLAYVEELPGANTQGRTLGEARRNLREAAQLIIEANCDLARRASEGRTVVHRRAFHARLDG